MSTGTHFEFGKPTMYPTAIESEEMSALFRVEKP